MLTAIHLAIWALTGFGYLWPIWPALSLGAAFGFHAMLSLMAEGRTNAAIARALVVTPGAVEKHISNIFSKLDLPASDDDHRRVLAVLAFLQASG